MILGQISQMSSFNFTVRPPQHVKIGSHRIEFLSGCAVQELTFASSTYVQVCINFALSYLLFSIRGD